MRFSLTTKLSPSLLLFHSRQPPGVPPSRTSLPKPWPCIESQMMKGATPILLAIFAFGTACFADDKPRTIVTRDHEVYEKAVIVDRGNVSVTIEYDAGVVRVALENLPADIQKELGLHLKKSRSSEGSAGHSAHAGSTIRRASRLTPPPVIPAATVAVVHATPRRAGPCQEKPSLPLPHPLRSRKNPSRKPTRMRSTA